MINIVVSVASASSSRGETNIAKKIERNLFLRMFNIISSNVVHYRSSQLFQYKYNTTKGYLD